MVLLGPREPMDSRNLSSRPTSIRYSSPDKGIIILDIPRTLEECQLPSGHETIVTRRIRSVEPIAQPFETPEPKDNGYASQNKSAAAQIADLMTTATIQDALEHTYSSFHESYCLPRITDLEDAPNPPSAPFIPENATFLHGSIQELSSQCRESAPKFRLVVLDPPWPNRSVRRKTAGYSTAYNLDEMGQLLSHIPIPSHLSPDGLVAIWITNKPSIIDLLSSPSGLFAQWGLELVTEWTWVKVTASGEPIFDVESAWRKPWEKLLIAKRTGTPTPQGLRSKTIFAVPDVHSRKPNLRGLFDELLEPGYDALEVFARNLTAGWWSWGNEVLQFQEAHHWVDQK